MTKSVILWQDWGIHWSRSRSRRRFFQVDIFKPVSQCTKYCSPETFRYVHTIACSLNDGLETGGELSTGLSRIIWLWHVLIFKIVHVFVYILDEWILLFNVQWAATFGHNLAVSVLMWPVVLGNLRKKICARKALVALRDRKYFQCQWTISCDYVFEDCRVREVCKLVILRF